MKNLKLLNKKYLSIIFVFLILSFTAKSQEPVDIWSLEEKTSKENTTAIEQKDEEIVSEVKEHQKHQWVDFWIWSIVDNPLREGF